MKIGVLAMQGAYREHLKILKYLGIEAIDVRYEEDIDNIDGLIIPGGESTTMGKLIKTLGLYDKLKSRIENNMPVWGTCAGMILLAKNIVNEDYSHLNVMNISVIRNAYGRQLGSFHTTHEMKGVGMIPMNFIRAPYVTKCTDEVEILAQVDEKIVAVQYKNQLGLAFHPEVTDCDKVHAYFLDMCQKR